MRLVRNRPILVGGYDADKAGEMIPYGPSAKGSISLNHKGVARGVDIVKDS